MKNFLKVLMPLALILVAVSATAPAAERPGDRLARAIAGAHRDPANVRRDRYRHPAQVLRFFGIRPDMTVVEIWPSTGWWTEILAPYLRNTGTYYAATAAPERSGENRRHHSVLFNKFKKYPDIYNQVKVTELSPPQHMDIAPPGSADMVLTFRNAHNWVAGGYAEQVFQAFYKALKPGGILGVVDHRADPGTPLELMKKSGYLTEKLVKGLAEKAGFKFVAESEINANPLDPKVTLPDGVWTLPPTLELCGKMPAGAKKNACVAKYTAIGESDRMTLKFQKPAR
jgi:predicted methyltransferase